MKPTTDQACYAVPYCDAHLCDAQPLVADGIRVVEANLEVSRFVGVESELLEVNGRPARLNLAVEITIVVHVQSPSPLGSLVKRHLHPGNVLGVFERVLDAA